ncbi:MAG: 1-deoxy-D-xylulose-5-phosphate reductoisomerase [Tenericutes bacterium]|nr:1-deoxy-D-xylulose-5-phosphate reductoisomerase [Mycoplasmatota bacterium]
MKNIYLLGATGSIGTQTIEIIEKHPDAFCLKAISGYKNLDSIIEIASKFCLDLIAVKDMEDALIIQKHFPNTKVVYGENGLIELAVCNPKDKEGLLINALVGMVGLKPTIESIQINRNVLLANKESLVVGGHLIKDLLEEHDVHLFPIDSEHNAIWQMLQGENPKFIKKLYITASGGSFRDLSRAQLSDVTVSQALKHPNWTMGSKITIDSATMMNKGFEIIEAAYLFDMDIENIVPIIHRESIIHSMVEYIDNSISGLLATPDMRMPISYAMFYPEREESLIKPLDFTKLSKLTFEEVDYERYPLVKLAIKAYALGGSARTVLNAANEACVDLFLKQKIKFIDIETIVSKSVNTHKVIAHPSLDEIYEIDKAIKKEIYKKYNN